MTPIKIKKIMKPADYKASIFYGLFANSATV